MIGIDIVNSKAESRQGVSAAEGVDLDDVHQARSIYQKIVIPMAMPLLVGLV